MDDKVLRWTRLLKGTPFDYALAVVVTALMLLVRWLLNPVLGDYTPYITLYVGISLLSIYVGLGPSVFSTVLGLIAVEYWFVPPHGTFAKWNLAFFVSAVVYLAVCASIIAIGELSRRLRAELERSKTLFETFLDSSPVASFLKDAGTGQYVYANKAAKAQLTDDCEGKTDFDLRPGPEALKRRERELQLLWEEGSGEFVETVLSADGEHSWLTLEFPVMNRDRPKMLGGNSLDITDRKRAEEQIAQLERERSERDRADIAAMLRLHEVGLLCLQKDTTPQQCFDALLDTAIFLTAADKGTMQLLDPVSGALTIVAQRGFETPFLRHFSQVQAGSSAVCGAALASISRVVVEDVTQSDLFADTASLAVLLEAGVRGVQSTPLQSRAGDVVGMMATHFAESHRPQERELRLMDLLARQAVEFLERMRAEETLRQNEERLRLAADAAQFGTYDADFINGVRYWSPELRAIVGLSPDGPTGGLEDAPDFVHTDDRERVRQKMSASHDPKGPGVIEDEHRVVWPDGSIHWVLVKGKTFFEGEGEQRRPVRATGVALDVTERKRAEELLVGSRKTLSDLIERAPFGIYIVDSSFRIAQINLGSQEGAFRNVRPVIGRDFAEAIRIIWPDDVAAQVIATFRHTLETGEPYYSSRFINPRHDLGTTESYEWQLHRMTLPDGQYGVICYYFDSTELREAEQALRESEERLRRFLHAAPTGLTRCSRELRYVAANPAYAAIAGFAGRADRRSPHR